MIACTEKCKYQKKGECTYEQINLSTNLSSSPSNCMYYEQE